MNSLMNRARLSLDFLGRKSLCTGKPIEFSIELTNRCNLKCMMCPREDRPKRGIGDMSFATFQKIIDQAGQYLEFTYLHLAGEPLLHPHLAEFIEYAASKGVRTGLSTNGTLLSHDRAKMLTDSPLASLIISLDGTDAETYKKIRGAESFAKVVDNSLQFLQMKKQANRGPHTTLQMICMQKNRHQAKEFVHYWKGAGADAVRLKRFFNFAGTVADYGYDESGSRQGGHGPSRPAEAGGKKRPPCLLPWRQMAFYYTGDAVSCCHDFLHQTVLGNIHEKSLAELWNSSQMAHIREKHTQGLQREIPLCSGCNQPEINTLQLLGLTIMSAGLAKRVLIMVERLARVAGLKTPY